MQRTIEINNTSLTITARRKTYLNNFNGYGVLIESYGMNPKAYHFYVETEKEAIEKTIIKLKGPVKEQPVQPKKKTRDFKRTKEIKNKKPRFIIKEYKTITPPPQKFIIRWKNSYQDMINFNSNIILQKVNIQDEHMKTVFLPQ